MIEAGKTADLQGRVEEIDWYHRIDLGGGIVTPGVNDTPALLRRLALPADLSGMSVLDVGSWDGFYAFECERRGAERVLAIDSFVWQGQTWGSKAGFDLAREALGSAVEDRVMDVHELSPESVGTFDIVLFLGVLYHLHDPLGALQRLRAVTRGSLILETHCDLRWSRRPAAAFYEGREVFGDETMWWGPNRAAVEAWTRTAGFSTVREVCSWSRRADADAGAGRVAGALWDRLRRRPGPWIEALRQGHAVFHAKP